VKRLLTGLCFWLATQGLALAEGVEFESARLWAAPERTRVVFDTSGPVSHKVFSLRNPERLVIDVSAAQTAQSFSASRISGGVIRQVRTAANNKTNVLRIVLDLKQPVKPRTFSLRPNEQYGHRLVVDLYGSRQAGNKGKPAVAKKTATHKPTKLRDLVIAIDAGHGGDDPGAIGRRKTREKDVVLAIARRLADLVRKEPGMRPVLIREGDYYIGLRQPDP
jgi:N-acetylmuramoyl-L-alanine amidase